MADYTRLAELAETLQEQANALAEEVAQLQVAAADADGPFIAPTDIGDGNSIVGGTPTDLFPECCALACLVNGVLYFTCSGTLIAPTLVVTARHCRNVTHVYLKGSDVTSFNRKPFSAPGIRMEIAGGELIRVIAEYSHPTMDLRLLVLAQPATIPPVHVARDGEAQGATARLVGFGTIDAAGRLGYGLKRMVDVPIQSLDCAGATDPQSWSCLTGEIVAGHRGLKLDSCHGDSGGPLYILDDSGAYYLLGATSRGINNDAKCGDGGIYVRVDLQLGWVRAVAGPAAAGI